MQVGLFLTSQHHLDKNMLEALDEQFPMVHHARDNGWHSFWSGQHYLNEGNNQQFQLVPFLARMMPEAGDMTVGLGILLINLHNPVYVAETVATLDIMARGRFVFGVGLGYRDVEFDAFNVPKGKRVERFVECLELTQRLWTEESVTHHSDTCKLDNVRMNIRPLQKPRPPLWIAANNDPAIRRAARMSDVWFLNPHNTLDTLSAQMDIYREELQVCGKPFPAEVPLMREIYCAPTRDKALELAGPYLAGKYEAYAKWGQDKAMPAHESLDKSFDELTAGRFVIGSPDECYEQLKPYIDSLGANHLIFRTHWAGMPVETALASMKLISEELMPALGCN